MSDILTKLQLAAYDHVDSMVSKADVKDKLLWHGWALRESFEAGARWQENELAALRAELAQLRAELEAANGRLARMREFAKPFADAYEMEKASHLSGIVCVRNMAALTTYGDWKELAVALKETE